MSVKHPKPDFRGKEKPPYGPWMEWAERMLAGAIGSYASLSAAISAAIEAGVAAIDLSDIEADIADHETRLDALEADDAAYKTTGYTGKARGIGGTAGASFYMWPVGIRDTNATSSIEIAQMIWPRAGTFRNLRYQNLNPIADADTYSFTLNIDGSDTALTITGLTPGTSTVQTDLVHSVPVTAGQLVCFKQLVGGASLTTGVEPTWCFDFEDAA